MANLDDHDNEFVIADFIHDSVDALSYSIPFLCRKLYATFSAWIVTQRFDPFQNTRDIFFRDAL
jgi:hypothetical protein